MSNLIPVYITSDQARLLAFAVDTLKLFRLELELNNIQLPEEDELDELRETFRLVYEMEE